MIIRCKLFIAVLVVVYGLIFNRCQPNAYREGERLYRTNCANCHMENGEGLTGLIPPLANADYMEKNRSMLPCIIRYGLQDSITVNGKIYAEQMPGAPHLSEIHVANLLNYVQNSWGNRLKPYQLDEIRALLDQCEKR
jgi:mono/diheme cytochrome c family protein